MTKPPDDHDRLALVAGSFVIAGFAGEPGSITGALSITPDEVGRAGETRQLSGSQRQYTVPTSYWELHARKRRAVGLEECISELVTRMEPASNKLQALPSNVTKKVLVQVSLEPNGSAPGLLLAPELVARLAKLGVALEVDIN